MGEVPLDMKGLLPKITSLFNNQQFSDFQFVFDTDNRSESILYGHKLLLALRSNYFATIFYEDKESVQQMKFPSNARPLFYHLLKFLYTDEVNFQKLTVNEVEDLYSLAKRFHVSELEAKCLDCLLKERITIYNIFPRYECALSENIEALLNSCRNFVRYEAVSVFESAQFKDASADVVEDVLKQDELFLATELTVVNAVLKWGKSSCKKNNILLDDKSLREQIYSFLKYLRFLTLSFEEFQSILEEHNIFTAYESTILTRKILQPQSEIHIPEYICTVTKNRGNFIVNSTPAKPIAKLENLMSPTSVLKENSINNLFVDDSLHSLKLRKQNILPQNMSADSSLLDISQPKLQTQKSVPSKAKTQHQKKFSYEIKKSSPFAQGNDSHQLKTSKFQSSPNLFSSNQHFPISVSSFKKTFQLPLCESSQTLMDSFLRDLVCSCTFQMKIGEIKLYGFDLYIKNVDGSSDKLVVDVQLSGFSENISMRYNVESKNNVFPIMFQNPMLLREKGKLEVSIDNLYLNRCCVYSSDMCELNSGHNCICEITMKSNQKVYNGSAFLINQFFYSPL